MPDLSDLAYLAIKEKHECKNNYYHIVTLNGRNVSCEVIGCHVFLQKVYTVAVIVSGPLMLKDISAVNIFTSYCYHCYSHEPHVLATLSSQPPQSEIMRCDSDKETD